MLHRRRSVHRRHQDAVRSFSLGDYSFSTYRALLPLIALLLLFGALPAILNTSFGVYARATIQNPNMARASGHTDRLYTLTFALGAGLAGLTGALYAPTMTAVPTMGRHFIVQAFVTVVVGGANVIAASPPPLASSPSSRLRSRHLTDS